MQRILQEIFHRHPDNPILTVSQWPYPAQSVFNCGATLYQGETILLTRVEDRRGISHLTLARSKDGMTGWNIEPQPALSPDPENFPEEIWGIEDPRITFIPELGFYFITYTAYSRGGPLVSLARTADFVHFERLGAIMPPENKDAALFPIRFNDRWLLLHRPSGANPNLPAHIWLAFSPDLKHWGDQRILFCARAGAWWDAHKIGLGPQPLQVPEGWLILYHGVRKTLAGVIYRLGLALLATDDPSVVLHRSDEWVFSPQAPYERDGDVDDVVFPCGWTVKGDEVFLYYGGADSCIALATAKLSDLRTFVLSSPQPKPAPRWC